MRISSEHGKVFVHQIYSDRSLSVGMDDCNNDDFMGGEDDNGFVRVPGEDMGLRGDDLSLSSNDSDFRRRQVRCTYIILGRG